MDEGESGGTKVGRRGEKELDKGERGGGGGNSLVWLTDSDLVLE